MAKRLKISAETHGMLLFLSLTSKRPMSDITQRIMEQYDGRSLEEYRVKTTDGRSFKVNLETDLEHWQIVAWLTYKLEEMRPELERLRATAAPVFKPKEIQGVHYIC